MQNNSLAVTKERGNRQLAVSNLLVSMKGGCDKTLIGNEMLKLLFDEDAQHLKFDFHPKDAQLEGLVEQDSEEISL